MKKKNLLFPLCGATLLMLAAVSLLSAQSVSFYHWEDSGITLSSGAPGGLTIGDYNGDLKEDLLILNGAVGNIFSNTLYQNVESAFENIGTVVLPEHNGKFNSGAFADYNGDGYTDLYLGAWNYNSAVFLQNHLFTNTGSGGFTATNAGPATSELYSTTGCSWADYDGDGWVDIFIANTSRTFGPASNVLYHNEGDGTFSKVENNIIYTGTPQFSFSGNWADADGDKDLDLFVANASGRDQLYLNDGSGNFSLYEDEEAYFNVNPTLTYRGTWGDYDNDGDFDLFVLSEGTNFLYNNDGDGQFRRVDGEWEQTQDTPAGAWADFDNDGDLDLLVTSFYSNMNTYFRNDGGELHLDQDAIYPLLDGFSGVADFDNDGFLDVAVANGGFPNTLLHTAVYLNQGNANNWAEFSLKAYAPNTSAIGAVARLKANIDGQDVWQMRQVASSSHESNGARLHFGLGDAAMIDSLVVEWPDGQIDVFENMEPNFHFFIEEGFVGLKEHKPLQAELSLSPNPARNSTKLYLETEEAIGRLRINLYHLSGQLAWSAEQHLNERYLDMDIPLSGLPAGMYILQVVSEGKQIAKTLIITP